MTKLKGLLKDADELYLATDEDREGEAIAWHLLDELKPKVPVHRMVFHEITPQAISAAVESPRADRHGPRRGPGGAAHPRPPLRLRGQPGAVAQGDVGPLRRPRAVRRDAAGGRPGARADEVPRRVVLGPRGHLRRRREARPADVPGHDCTPSTTTRVARGSDFGQDGELVRQARPRKRRSSTSPRPAPRRWSTRCTTPTSRCARSSRKPYTRKPYAPFRTTTLQQEASRKLGFGASRTMSVAQRLYENGFITYMRTDSTTLSETAVARGPVAGPRPLRRGVHPGRAARSTPRR